MGWEETREKSRETFFTSLYERYYFMLQWMAYQKLFYSTKSDRITEEQISELVEATFEKAVPHYLELHRMRDAQRLTYLKNTMRCVLAERRDKKKYELDTIPISAMMDSPPKGLKELDAYMKEKRERQGIRYVLNSIKPEDLWLLYYKNYLKYSDAEIAAALEIPERYVPTFFKRADYRIRSYMQQADFGYIRYESKLRQQELRKSRFDSNRYGEEEAMYELKRLAEVLIEDAGETEKKK